MLAEEQVALDGNDFRAQLAKLKAAGGDLLFISSYGRNVAIVADQARELGITIPFAATSWVQIPEVLKAKGAQGLLTTRLPFDPESAVRAKFKERYKTDAGFFAVQYYNGGQDLRGRGGSGDEEERAAGSTARASRPRSNRSKSFDTISAASWCSSRIMPPSWTSRSGVLKDGKVEVEKLIKAAH